MTATELTADPHIRALVDRYRRMGGETFRMVAGIHCIAAGVNPLDELWHGCLQLAAKGNAEAAAMLLVLDVPPAVVAEVYGG